ncbi:hypothetical protein [Nitrosospira multiformis]|uniref:hypothetical protein n=1 Tax=Nitrosospira multiformis TaxID=1231 RepID=UPI0015879449|nr:hypothetical protein [Nitrosospira multiformis]
MRVVEGGHDVAIRKIIARYTRSLANCRVAARLADRAYVMTIPSKMPRYGCYSAWQTGC